MGYLFKEKKNDWKGRVEDCSAEDQKKIVLDSHLCSTIAFISLFCLYDIQPDNHMYSPLCIETAMPILLFLLYIVD